MVEHIPADKVKNFIDASITETQFQRQVEGIARENGWLYNHNSDSRRSTKGGGLPDLIMVRDLRLIFAELKKQKAPQKLPESQQKWRDSIEHIREFISDEGVCNPVIEYYLWRPSDLERIREILS